MPGVIGSGPTPCLAAQLCALSLKLNHSNSMPASTVKPSFSARLSTRFKVWRGHSACGLPSGLTNSPRKKGTRPTPGTPRGGAGAGGARARGGAAGGVRNWAKKHRPLPIPGHLARGARIDAHQRVRVAMLPAGQPGVVIAMVMRIPAQHHVAKAEAGLGCAFEFVTVQILAAQNAIDITDCHLDLGAARFERGGHGGMKRRVRHRAIVHQSSPCRRADAKPCDAALAGAVTPPPPGAGEPE